MWNRNKSDSAKRDQILENVPIGIVKHWDSILTNKWNSKPKNAKDYLVIDFGGLNRCFWWNFPEESPIFSEFGLSETFAKFSIKKTKFKDNIWKKNHLFNFLSWLKFCGFCGLYVDDFCESGVSDLHVEMILKATEFWGVENVFMTFGFSSIGNYVHQFRNGIPFNLILKAKCSDFDPCESPDGDEFILAQRGGTAWTKSHKETYSCGFDWACQTGKAPFRIVDLTDVVPQQCIVGAMRGYQATAMLLTDSAADELGLLTRLEKSCVP